MKRENIAILGIIALFLVFALTMLLSGGPEVSEEITREESRMMARDFMNSSPTYLFDGVGLDFDRSAELDCEKCWEFYFTFKSRQAGYGDRSGQFLAQVITPHTARIRVEKGEITEAVLDESWNMLTQNQMGADTMQPQTGLQLVAGNLTAPLAMAVPDDESGRAFIMRQDLAYNSTIQNLTL